MSKNKVSKFNKQKTDEIAINSRLYQKTREEIDRYGAKGVEELMKQGDIKEAAVVFSREGMSAFAKMFSNSVESAVERTLAQNMDSITKSIETRIENIIQSKMLEMLEGMTEGMRKFQSEFHRDMVNKTIQEGDNTEITNMVRNFKISDLFKDVEKPSEKVSIDVDETPEVKEDTSTDGLGVDDASNELEEDKEPSTDSNVEESNRNSETFKVTYVQPSDGGKPYHRLMYIGQNGLQPAEETTVIGSNRADMDKVKPYILTMLKNNAGKPVKSVDIYRTLWHDFNMKMTNPTNVLRYIMTVDSNVDNVGFGEYMYEEKNFKPLV